MAEVESQVGSIDEDEAKTEADAVRVWQSEIQLALNSEKAWRKDAERVLKVYRSESEKSGQSPKDTFNILWANTEIKRQSVINTSPIPDCRRRYGDEDVVGREVSELLNRGITYTLDCQDGLTKLIAAANDFLLVGRGEIRVRYKGHMSEIDGVAEAEDDVEQEQEQTLEYEECLLEHVNWKEFFHGPAKEWNVPWVGFAHDLEKEECEERFGKEKAKNLSYTVTSDKNKRDDDSDLTVFKRTTVYEIWDKDSKKVYWIGKDYNDEYLDTVDDPTELQDFFPVPRPVYAVEDPNSLVPIIEYCQYETLAKELEDITRRLLRLTRACKVRGIYDSRISEVEKVLDGDDNELISATNAASLAEIGGLEKAIWFMPLETIVGTIQTLQGQRIAVKSMIDELNGMSDIVRGSTNPNETATAQRIKANFASARLDKQKQAFQYFARNLVRLVADVISKFKRETLTVMTGLNYPTEQEKQQAQQQLAQLQQPPQPTMPGMPPQPAPPPPDPKQIQQLQAVLQKPSWEDIEKVLRSDITREYRIDIETDSTMAADQQAEQEVLASFMQAMAQFTTMASGAVQTGLMSPEAAKQIMLSFTRKFRLGKDVEEELEKPMPPKGPDPEMAKMQAEAQQAQQQHQMDMQAAQQKAQLDQQTAQADLQAKQQQMQMDAQAQQAELAHKQQMYQLELAQRQQELEFERQSLELKNKFAQEDHVRKQKEKSSVAQ